MKVLHTGTFDVNASNNGTKVQRIEWIDIAKGLFMFFVILSHSGYVPFIYKCIYSPFFLSGYFFISGYFLLGKTKNINFGQKIVNVLTSILLPYILYWILSYSVEQIIIGNYNFMMQLFYNILEGKKLWFISALFVSEIITVSYLFLVRNIKEYGIYIYPLISLLVYFLLPNVDYYWYFRASFLASFYLGLGMIMKIHSTTLLVSLKNNWFGIISSFLFVCCIVLEVLYLKQSGSFHYGFSNISIFLIESVIAIYTMLFLCTKITRYNSLLIFMGQSSLLLYFFQNQILRITKLLGSKLFIDNPSYWYSILTVFIVVVILYLPIKFVQKYLPILAGKYRIELD